MKKIKCSRFTWRGFDGKKHSKLIPIGALVCFRWIDAEESPGWDDEVLGLKKAWQMATYGLWRGHDKYFCYYGDTRLENGVWGGDRRIPRGMITDVRIVESEPYLGEWLLP